MLLIPVYLTIAYLNGLAGQKIRIANLRVPTFLASQPEIENHDIVTTIFGQKTILINHLNLETEAELIVDLALSPDRQKICFETQAGRTSALYWTNWNGENISRIGPGTSCRWSPDSIKIAYLAPKSRGNDVACFWPETNLSLNLTNRQPDAQRNYHTPIWSLNNEEVFSQFTYLDSNSDNASSGIAIINITNRSVKDK